MAKKLNKEERQKLRETEAKKQKTKKTIYIVAFVVALLLGIIFTINTLINLQKLGVIDPNDEEPVTESTHGIEGPAVENIQNGKLIIYNPITDIKIIRNSVAMPTKATSIIKWNEKKLEQLVDSNEIVAVSSLNVSGNNYICQLPNTSKVSDSILIVPDGPQDNSTIYILYSDNERIELSETDVKSVMLTLSGGTRLETNGGKFQFSVIFGNRTIRIVGSVSEPCVILIDWDKEKDTFTIDTPVLLNDCQMTILENNQVITELPIEGDNYGAMFDFLTTTSPVVQPRRVKRPYFE